MRIHFKPPVVLPAHAPHQHDGKQPPTRRVSIAYSHLSQNRWRSGGDYLEQGFAEGFFHPHGTGIVKHDGYDGSENTTGTEINFTGIADELEFPVDEQ